MANSKTALRVGLVSPVHTLDPRETQDVVAALVIRQIFETPYDVGDDGSSVEARLFQDSLRAEPASRQRPVYSAAVRPGIRFSDGTELQATHVVDTLSKAADLKQHASVACDGDRVRLALKRPNCRFELTLTQICCAVSLERHGQLLGTGPYRPAPGATLDALRLVRNPHYRGRVGFDEVLFTVYPPPPDGGNESLLRAIEAGEVDFTNAVTRKEAERPRGARTRIEPGNSTAILAFNTERLPDPAVRKALALAIDRREIASAFYSNALTFTATSLLPRSMGGGHDDGLSHDLQQALVLLSRPDVRPPKRLRMLLIWSPRPYLPNPRAAGEKIARYLERLGTQVEIVPTASSAEYLRRIADGDYDLNLAGWIAETPDPAVFLEANLSSRLIPAPGKAIVSSTNNSRWRSADADRALQCYQEEPSEVCKQEVLGLVAEEVPLFPLMYGPTIYVHSRRVANLKPCPFGLPKLAALEPAASA